MPETRFKWLSIFLMTQLMLQMGHGCNIKSNVTNNQFNLTNTTTLSSSHSSVSWLSKTSAFQPVLPWPSHTEPKALASHVDRRMCGLTVRQDSRSSDITLRPSMTMRPAMMALVVAMAGMMLPAIAEPQKNTWAHSETTCNHY